VNHSQIRKLIGWSLCALVAILALSWCLIATNLDSFSRIGSSLDTTVSLRIARGSSLQSIARQLYSSGLVSSEKKFYWYIRLRTQAAGKLQAGYFIFKPHMSPAQIVTHLQFGKEEEVRVTIPEGTNLKGITAILVKAGLATEESIDQAADNAPLREKFGLPQQGAGGQAEIPGGIEGYLFPDTYLLPKSFSASSILWQMRNRLNAMLPIAIETRMKELQLNFHQVLTLASLVEMEAAKKEERAIIAGVFYNRLKRKMKLQTDPTVSYGIENFSGRIRKVHLRTAHPYNTYINSGLPPGPISSPGKQSIIAVLWPAQHDFLYFVSKNDGTHEFCKNLKCHNAAVKKWQLSKTKAQSTQNCFKASKQA